MANLYGVGVPSATPATPVMARTELGAALSLDVDTDVTSARTFLMCMRKAPDTSRKPETTM